MEMKVISLWHESADYHVQLAFMRYPIFPLLFLISNIIIEISLRAYYFSSAHRFQTALQGWLSHLLPVSCCQYCHFLLLAAFETRLLVSRALLVLLSNCWGLKEAREQIRLTKPGLYLCPALKKISSIN